MRKFYLVFLVVLSSCLSKEVAPPEAILPLPSQVQLDWQEKELFAFIHFTVNTFTSKEWGYGDEHPDIFNPVDFDPSKKQQLLVLNEF